MSGRANPWLSIALVVALVATLMVVFPSPAQAATTGSAVEVGVNVRQTNFDPEPIDPSGIAYLGSNNLLVVDSEINEVAVGPYNNIWRMSRTGAINQSGVIDETPVEPTGLDYNSANGHIYVSNDDGRRIQDIAPGGDGVFGTNDDVSTMMSTIPFGVLDAEDVAWDPVGGRIFIAGGTERKIVSVSPGPNGLFDGVGDVIGVTINLAWLTNDIEGIGYRAATDTLLVVEPTGGGTDGIERIFELTKTGRLIRTIEIKFTELPSDVAVAPASMGPGNNLYVVDRGSDTNPNPATKDGRMYEISASFPNLAPWVNAGPDSTTPVNRSMTLQGDAYDDNQPTKSAPSLQWTKVSGPGSVTFANSKAAVTAANFSTPGNYKLRLTASDGSMQSFDEVNVTVQSAVTNVVGGVDRSTGIWRFFDKGVQTKSFYFGNPADFPFYGDWDCDGDETPGLYRQSDGYVYLRNSNTQGIADVSFFFGNPGDVPIAGDFNGDGCDTVSIYRPSEAKFYIINELGQGDAGLGAADYSFFYGVPGDVPFVGDWTGDGIDTPGLRRNSDGFVYLRNTNTQGIADVNYFYGNNGDIVFTGDWDNDGDDTLGLYRPSNGRMYLRYTNSTGIADFDFFAGMGLYPVAGDN